MKDARPGLRSPYNPTPSPLFPALSSASLNTTWLTASEKPPNTKTRAAPRSPTLPPSQLSIGHPWDERQGMGVVGELYPNSCAKYPVANVHISCQLSLPPLTDLLTSFNRRMKRRFKPPSLGYNISRIHRSPFPNSPLYLLSSLFAGL